jgi:hypothetical protein
VTKEIPDETQGATAKIDRSWFHGGMPFSLAATPQADKGSSKSSSVSGKPVAALNPLKPPADGVRVACLISDGAVVIDFCGPAEVFGNAMPGGRMDRNAFRVYTVAETAKPIPASGGMKFIPDYRLENAPVPEVIVIPAQSEPSEAMLELDPQVVQDRRPHHVGLHRLICAGQAQTIGRKGGDHASRCLY